MKYRRKLSLLLALCILLSVLPGAASAANVELTASEPLIAFIKSCEGFAKYAMWDYQHYSIGYGTTCQAGEYPEGITEEQADELLRKFVAGAEASVNEFAAKNGLNLTQNEFDCMVSFTYALGAAWMSSGYELPGLFIRGCTELELMNCMGNWVNAGGQTLNGLIHRRMREVYIYFHGEYNKTDRIQDDVPYACLKFDAGGGTVSTPRIYTFRGEPYGLEKSLPTPTRTGYRFLGWCDDAGDPITNDTVATSVITTAYAQWEYVPEPGNFTDVRQEDWFYEDVKAAATLGIFDGYADGSFLPMTQMTRAMFAQVLFRIAGEPECMPLLPFADVPEEAWYYQAVCWAYQTGVVNGVSEVAFAPERKITREQMATMLYKYSQTRGAVDASAFAPLDDYGDADQVSGYARDPMQWAVGTGLIQGVGGNLLSPNTYATRAQAATILVRLTNLVSQGVG